MNILFYCKMNKFVFFTQYRKKFPNIYFYLAVYVKFSISRKYKKKIQFPQEKTIFTYPPNRNEGKCTLQGLPQNSPFRENLGQSPKGELKGSPKSVLSGPSQGSLQRVVQRVTLNWSLWGREFFKLFLDFTINSHMQYFI